MTQDIYVHEKGRTGSNFLTSHSLVIIVQTPTSSLFSWAPDVPESLYESGDQTGPLHMV